VPTYLTREDETLAVLSPEQLIKELSTNNAVPAELDLDLATTLKAEAASGKLVLVLGAGPIDDWARQHLI
jgi:UDP-N-acetylmuramate--alanine ligase